MNLETAYNYVLAKTKNGKVCPAHEDDHGSLSLDQVDVRILLKCHAGCEFKKIVAALGMRSGDFFEKPQNRKKLSRKKRLVTDMMMKTVDTYLTLFDSNLKKLSGNRLPMGNGQPNTYKRFPINYLNF